MAAPSSPAMPIFVDGAHASYRENQLRLMNLAQKTDAMIRCGNTAWNVHRATLAGVSRYFEKAFYGDFNEAETAVVQLPERTEDEESLEGHTFEEVSLLITYCYGLGYYLPEDQAKNWDRHLQMLAIANYFQIPTLEHLIWDNLSSLLDKPVFVDAFDKLYFSGQPIELFLAGVCKLYSSPYGVDATFEEHLFKMFMRNYKKLNTCTAFHDALGAHLAPIAARILRAFSTRAWEDPREMCTMCDRPADSISGPARVSMVCFCDNCADLMGDGLHEFSEQQP